jgi:hypothetical protein
VKPSRRHASLAAANAALKPQKPAPTAMTSVMAAGLRFAKRRLNIRL